MIKRSFVPSILFFLALALLPSATQGQNISQMWEFTPKPGSGPAFEEALKAHIEYRKAQGDPWTWDVYQQAVGPNPGTYYVASWNHTWSDLDAYDAWGAGSEASVHFQASAGPLLENMSNSITQDGPISRYPDDPNWAPALVNVTVFYLNPGKQMAFQDALMKFHEAFEESDVDFYYGSDVIVSGGTGPAVSIAGFGDSWADFADPDTPMEQMMAEKYGEDEAQEIFTAFSEGVDHWESFIVRHRPDLSGADGM
jgi:hypothetical protein